LHELVDASDLGERFLGRFFDSTEDVENPTFKAVP
jgi:hypothetical protein